MSLYCSECCGRCSGKCATADLICKGADCKIAIAILCVPFVMLAITARVLFTPLEKIEQPLVLIDGSRIVSVSPRNAAEIPSGARHVDFGENVLAPGLIDIHIHGGSGYDVMQDDEPARAAFEKFL